MSLELGVLVIATNLLSFASGVYAERSGGRAEKRRLRDRIEGGVFALDHIWRCLTDQGKALMGPLLLAMMRDYRGIVHQKLGAQLQQSDVEAQIEESEREASEDPAPPGRVH